MTKKSGGKVTAKYSKLVSIFKGNHVKHIPRKGAQVQNVKASPLGHSVIDD